MARYSIHCDECMEEIPSDEVYWEDDRLYCRRCGSELENPQGDIFEKIVRNRSGFLFRDSGEVPDDDEEEDEVDGAGGKKGPESPPADEEPS